MLLNILRIIILTDGTEARFVHIKNRNWCPCKPLIRSKSRDAAKMGRNLQFVTPPAMRGMHSWRLQTGAWIARFSRGDQCHERAAAIWAKLKESNERIATSDSVFVETVSFFGRNVSASAAAAAG